MKWPKRILQIVHSMDRGGLETYNMNLYRAIDRSRLQFDFLVHTEKQCAYDEEILSMGGRIFRVPSRRASYIKNRIELDKFFREHTEYDTVHCHISCPTYITPIVFAKQYGIKRIIVHSRNSAGPKGVIHDISRFINKPLIKRYATHYFAISNLAAENMFHKNIPRDQILIIPNAIDAESFIYNPETRQRVRKAFNLGDKFVVGHVGRFAEQKNHKFILNIFREIYRREPNAVLMLVGDGELRAEIEAKISDLGLANNVILTGFRGDIPDLMQAMDVFLCPSLYEGFGRVLMEAQASGLPTLTSATTVPNIIKVTELLEFISLSESEVYWADKALSFANGYERRNTMSEIMNANFDVGYLADYFEKFYLE